MTYRKRNGETVVASLSIGNWLTLVGILLPIVIGGFASWMDLRVSLATLAAQMTAHEKRLDTLEAKKSGDSSRSAHDTPEVPLQAARPAVSFAH